MTCNIMCGFNCRGLHVFLGKANEYTLVIIITLQTSECTVYTKHVVVTQSGQNDYFGFK